jgi:1,4-alpha-glucan branching enzyme
MTTKQAILPSPYPRMGAEFKDDGVSFRVWAPNAKSVFVAGSFNNWAKDKHPLAKEENGVWSALVTDVKADDEYKFVIVSADGQTLWKNDPYCRSVKSQDGKGKRLGANVSGVVYPTDFVWRESDFKMPAWNELVIYELHIGSFTQDPANPAGHYGTFSSAIKKLDHLVAMGINAVEVMAVGEFPFDHSWGYNPIYIYAIEHAYGGPDAFRKFVSACHDRGIAVIFDVVYNHLGPTDLDLWQFDGWSENEGGGIYFYNDERAKTPWGDTRPDYGRDEVRTYLHDNAIRWLSTRRADGLRFDATNFIRNISGGDGGGGELPDGLSLLQWINNDIRKDFAGKITIAEDMQNNPSVTGDTADGGAGFNAQWDAGFVHTLRAAVIGQGDEGRDMFAVADAIQSKFNGDAFQRVIYTESHDEDANGHQRVPEEIWPGNGQSYFSKKRSALGAAITLTSPGIPMLFQGQEFVEDGYFSDEFKLDWQKAKDNAGIVKLFGDLIALRTNKAGTTGGLLAQNVNVFHVNNDDKIVAYHRFGDGEGEGDVIVVANFSNQSYQDYQIGLPEAGLWKIRLNSDAKLYCDEFSDCPSADIDAQGEGVDAMAASGSLAIGPYSLLVYSR